MDVYTHWSHWTVLPAEPASASMARDFVCVHLKLHGLEHIFDDVAIVVSELATNAVLHARTEFTLSLAMQDGLVRLEIQDESAGLPVRSTPDELDMNGRGLMLVELLSNEWGTAVGEDGRKCVWASFLVGAAG